MSLDRANARFVCIACYGAIPTMYVKGRLSQSEIDCTVQVTGKSTTGSHTYTAIGATI